MNEMLGINLIKLSILKKSRKSYNSRKYSKSKFWSRINYFFFRDKESLDILARSHLRTNNFRESADCYSKADDRGFSLLDHELNQFKAELGNENYVNAFLCIQNIKEASRRKASLKSLTKEIRGLSDDVRVSVLQEINEVSPLPTSLVQLLPWSPKKIDYSSDEMGYGGSSIRDIEFDRYRREIQRIRSSGAYQITKHLTEASRKPMKIVKLPVSLPLLVLDIIRQRRGSKRIKNSPRYVSAAPEERRDSIVFFPTNGVGFGHFTRLFAIAREIKKSNPEMEIVFFTTMPTLHVLLEEDIVCYHMPGRYRYSDMDATTWNSLCEEMLNLIFTLHRPKAFIFDGAFPYRGMLNSIKPKSMNMLKVWVRRGSVKKNSKKVPVDSIGHFHAIIKPGDSVPDSIGEENQNNMLISKVNPILLDYSDDSSESLGMGIRERLGIPSDSVACYVQLGAGRINDINSDLRMVVDAITDHEKAYAIIGESMLGKRIPISHERIRVLRDYPNSKYFESFDFAVIAGGYNSYHEVINASLPTICLPNLKTGRDDQLARVYQASSSGAMIVIKHRNERKIKLAINRIMDRRIRKKMRKRISVLRRSNGSRDAANWIINQIAHEDLANKESTSLEPFLL